MTSLADRPRRALSAFLLVLIVVLAGCTAGKQGLAEAMEEAFGRQYKQVGSFRLRQQVPWQDGGVAMVSFDTVFNRHPLPVECYGISYFRGGFPVNSVFAAVSSCGNIVRAEAPRATLQTLPHGYLALVQQNTSVAFGEISDTGGARVRVDWDDGRSETADVISGSYLMPREGLSEVKQVTLLDEHGSPLIALSFDGQAAVTRATPSGTVEPPTSSAQPPTSTPQPPALPPPTPTPAPASAEAPVSAGCPIDSDLIADGRILDTVPVRVAFITHDGLRMWEESAQNIRLLFPADDITTLAFSSDGRQIAFTRRSEQQQTSLWVVNAGGEHAVEVLSAEDFLAMNLSQTKDLAVSPHHLTWIPGTHKLAFSTLTLSAGDEQPDVFREMRVVDIHSGEVMEMLNHSQGGSFAFAPDGGAFTVAGDTSLSLYEAGGELIAEDIVRYPALGLGESYYHPPVSWSADATFFTFVTVNTTDSLALAHDPEMAATIWRARADGSAAEMATISGINLDHAFSPNLEQLAFMRISPQGPPLRELHIADVRGAWDVVYREGEGLHFGEWNPATDRLQFTFYDGRGEPGIGGLCREAAPLPSAPFAGSTHHMRWVDAGRFLFVADPERELYLGSLDGARTLIGRLGPEDRFAKTGLPAYYDFVLGEPAVPLQPTNELPAAVELAARLKVEEALPDGSAVRLLFTLTNHADAPFYVLKWFTPLEGVGGEIFRVERDGRALPYEGVLASRGDPTADSYLLLPAGGSVSAVVDLAGAYDFTGEGTYTIAFLSPRISHVARTEEEMAETLAELGPIEMRANEVILKIGAGEHASTSSDPAEGALVRYFSLLSEGNYADAVELHGGGYDVLLEWNPTADADDLVGLLKLGCTTNGLQCLPIKTITAMGTGAPNTFEFALQFENPDGSLFVLNPQGDWPNGTMPQSLFEYTVMKSGTGFVVQDLPVYAP